MIAEKIKKDVNNEFANFKKELQTHLKPSFDVSQTKQFLQTHIPKEIIYKSEILLDTLLNYLMENAQDKIKTADSALQNAFYDADFRKHIHDWVKQSENKLALDPDIVTYIFDPRLKQALIASAIAFVAGTSITLTLASSIVGTIITGIIAIILFALTFKITYDKASTKARESIKIDIDQYLDASQKQVFEWLEKVGADFENDFYTFCSTHGFALEEKPNE